MAFHEKHQYYYEKYLRNEMAEKERHEFEEKLSADESFKYSFHHYKNHRNQFLSDRIIEDKIEAKKRWRLNSWLYLVISISGIILFINYSLLKESKTSESTQVTKNSWNLINQIPFLRSQNETQKAQTNIKVEKANLKTDNDSVTIEQPVNTKSNEQNLAEENNDFANDIMELDSFVTAFDKSYFDQRYRSIKSETDSIIVDSMLDILTAKSVRRNLQQSKPKIIYAEFWRSPVNFKGYKFNGKKLIIYGINYPFEIYLLRDNDEFILRMPHNEFMLTNDNNFHKF